MFGQSYSYSQHLHKEEVKALESSLVTAFSKGRDKGGKVVLYFGAENYAKRKLSYPQIDLL